MITDNEKHLSQAASGTVIESKEIHNPSAFMKINNAADLLRDAMCIAGLTAKDAKIVLSDEAFESVFDDRKIDGHRPEWRSHGIEIEPTNKVVK